MGAQIGQEPGPSRPQVSPKLCRQLCCETSGEDIIELFDTAAKSTMEDPSWSTMTLQASYSRAVGWPEHFERELDELRILGVLGFELRGFGPRPPHRFHSGAVYTGQWCGNHRHGFGSQLWPDGAQYEGCWSNSSASGLGRFKFSDGSVYVGHWRGNRFHGLGAHYLADGTSYHGQWVHGSRDGVGVEICPVKADQPAATYWGDFCRGQKDGLGVCEWDNSQFAGQWRAGLISGHGVLTSDCCRRIYRGQWLHAKKHGRGVYTWPDGREHRGQYQLDAASGFGKFSWPDGKEYFGFWQNAHIIGPGFFNVEDERPPSQNFEDALLLPALLKAEQACDQDETPVQSGLKSSDQKDAKEASWGMSGLRTSTSKASTPLARVTKPLRRCFAKGGA
mmetsp:Transcript_60859/g.113816  ORF Transcript_60859/g.113816 Transcript_60859/m.113816 type:complete len:392 (-) Transcript_60859:114-1289(-)